MSLGGEPLRRQRCKNESARNGIEGQEALRAIVYFTVGVTSTRL